MTTATTSSTAAATTTFSTAAPATTDSTATAATITSKAEAATTSSTAEPGTTTLEGNIGADRLTGGVGNDSLYSDGYFDDDGRERDILSGGDGQDWLSFGQNDVANAGTGFDRVTLDFSGSGFNERWVFSAAAKTFNNGAYLVNAEVLTYHGGNGVDQHHRRRPGRHPLRRRPAPTP